MLPLNPMEVSTQFLSRPHRLCLCLFFLKLCIFSDQAHVHQMSAPLKYSIPHAVISFGPAGQLIRVTTGLSAQENVSHLEIHSLEVGSVKLFKKKQQIFMEDTTNLLPDENYSTLMDLKGPKGIL